VTCDVWRVTRCRFYAAEGIELEQLVEQGGWRVSMCLEQVCACVCVCVCVRVRVARVCTRMCLLTTLPLRSAPLHWRETRSRRSWRR